MVRASASDIRTRLLQDVEMVGCQVLAPLAGFITGGLEFKYENPRLRTPFGLYRMLDEPKLHRSSDEDYRTIESRIAQGTFVALAYVPYVVGHGIGAILFGMPRNLYEIARTDKLKPSLI